MKKIPFFLFLFLLFSSGRLPGAGGGEGRPFSIRGYVKEMPSVSILHRPREVNHVNLLHNRINLKYASVQRWEARAEFRNRVFIGDLFAADADFGKLISADEGLVDLGFLWQDQPDMVITTAIDRLLMRYNTNQLSCTVGRQRINWGINTVWNPLDLFNAYNFLDFDYEERPGSDALRVQYAPGQFSSLEFAVKYGKDFTRPVYAGLFRSNYRSYDVQFAGGLYEDDLVLGAGWAGPVKGAGFKGEVAWFKPVRDKSIRSDVFTYSLSLDYSFKPQWFGVLSVLYNDNVSPLPLNGFVATENLLSAKQLMPFRWSFYSGVTKQFSPVVSGSLAVVFSPERNSTVLFPSFLWNMRDNLDLDLTVQAFLGNDDEKYRSISTAAFIRFRWSY